MNTLRFTFGLAIATLATTSQAQMYTDLPPNDLNANVVAQRADSPIYSRMATDEKYREFAEHAVNIRGEVLNYRLVLESRAALFKDHALRKVYETRAGNFYVSYWVNESPNFRTMPFKRNASLALIVVDTVPADQANAQFKAVADKLPYVVYQIKWEHFKSNNVGSSIRLDDTGYAVKWDCKTSDGRPMPTMLQTIVIHKPKFKEEVEWYRTGYYIAEDGSLKDNGGGRRNICNKRSVGPEDVVPDAVRFLGGA